MQIRAFIKRITPKYFRYNVKNAYRNLKTIRTRRIFEQASHAPKWLDEKMLEELQQKYSYPPPIGYDYESLKAAAGNRVKLMLGFLGRNDKRVNTFLELGCSEGMLCHSLVRKGKKAVGIDIRSEFSEELVREGLSFASMDASQPGFKDESFDFICSFSSFEHFQNPDLVLDEAVRLLKPGGFIYLHYGPLYGSHYGLHAYRSITVPYCQFLFPKEVLTEFCIRKKLKPPAYASLNEWSIEEYRNIWNQHSSRLKRIKYYEYLNVDHLALIRKYPSCFKSKNISFENLIIPEVEILFVKKM